jgi:hypothetical protein
MIKTNFMLGKLRFCGGGPEFSSSNNKYPGIATYE